MEEIGSGNAPCGQCGTHVWRIAIILASREDDGNDGWWWECVPGQFCPVCGEPLRFFHKSNAIKTLLSLPVSEEIACDVSLN